MIQLQLLPHVSQLPALAFTSFVLNALATVKKPSIYLTSVATASSIAVIVLFPWAFLLYQLQEQV
jgi:hypothetical protein